MPPQPAPFVRTERPKPAPPKTAAELRAARAAKPAIPQPTSPPPSAPAAPVNGSAPNGSEPSLPLDFAAALDAAGWNGPLPDAPAAKRPPMFAGPKPGQPLTATSQTMVSQSLSPQSAPLRAGVKAAPGPLNPSASAGVATAGPYPSDMGRGSQPAEAGRAPAEAGRVVYRATDPYPPLSGRPNGLSHSLMDQNRITPRSPRTALEPEQVPMPTTPSKRARHPLVIVGNALITVFLLVAVLIGFGVFAGKSRFEAPGPLAEDKVVNIPRNVGKKDIADILAREGVIDQPWVFWGGSVVTGEDLKAGEYQFTKNISMRGVVDIITEGKVVQHLFTAPEGQTSEQIVQRLLAMDTLSGTIKEIPREGTLLPESYRFTRGTTRDSVIQRMQASQKRALQEIWERRTADLPVKSPEQLVTLASIVEKETGRPDERTRVAAVFANRLKTKMRLQSDPTIIYGLVGGKGTLGRPIMKSEIEQATPYNTYAIEGLPPGPIANPGRASMEAVANPARTKELYFVADGTGGHAFADSYDQHLKNVARLRAIERGDKPEAANAAQPARVEPAKPEAAEEPARSTRKPPPRGTSQR
jgi:UPF0755 protein